MFCLHALIKRLGYAWQFFMNDPRHPHEYTATATKEPEYIQTCFFSLPSAFPPVPSTSATNNLAYLLARDALHTLAAAARQAATGLNAGVAGTGIQFEDPCKRVMAVAEVSCQASTKVRNIV